MFGARINVVSKKRMDETPYPRVVVWARHELNTHPRLPLLAVRGAEGRAQLS